MITVNLENAETLRDTFQRLVPDVQAKVLRRMAQVAFRTARTQADTHTKTGALARSLRMEKVSEEAYLIDHNLQHAPHALFVHWGTRPHVIRPKTKKALRWAGGSGRGTHFVFAMHVNHPGYEGDPWLVNAADEVVRQFDAIVREIQGEPHA